MNYKKRIFSAIFGCCIAAPGFAADWGTGTLTGDYVGNAGLTQDSIVVSPADAASATFISNPVNIVGNSSVVVVGDIKNGGAAYAPSASGDMFFTDDASNSNITAPIITIGGGFANTAGILNISANTIDITGDFTTVSGSRTNINPLDWSSIPKPSVSAANISIADGLYMGNSATGSESVYINSDSAANIFVINSNSFAIDGFLNAALGKLVINSDNADIAGDISGNMDFNLTGDLTTGGASIGAGDGATWQSKFTSGGAAGNLVADGVINSTGDIIINGSVDGDLDITAKDMWVGQDLIGYWAIDVQNLYVLGNILGNGNITADNFIGIDGDASGNLHLKAGEIEIGGDLSGDVSLDAGKITVNQDILGGVQFRPNLPTGSGGFHENPDGGIAFKQVDLSVNGVYYFDDNSYLQLVKNLDDDVALLTVGKFDASGMTKTPNVSESSMDDIPNLEILIDGLDNITRIKLIEASGLDTNLDGDLEYIDLGKLQFAGVWFYNAAHTERLFQESTLFVDDCGGNKCLYTQLAMMHRIEPLANAAAGRTNNEVSMAAAIDDLIYARLIASGREHDFDYYYTNVMRQLFGNDDVFYSMMVGGGAGDNALGVMVSGSPDRALQFVRGFNLDEIAQVGGRLAVSGRVSRNATTDQLLDDFTWVRYYDKSQGWARLGFGGEISSFNFGADTKINKYIVGASLGYNSFNFGATTGHTFNLGLYGTYELNNWAKGYALADLSLHSATFAGHSDIVGALDSNFNTADVMLDLGVLHKIFDAYASGRAYVSIGRLGGYSVHQTSGGRDFMDVKSGGALVLAPGYELALGKDIYFSVGSFMRPYIKAGVEYDVLGGGARNLDFRFSGAETWRSWEASGGNDALWLRYGAGADFSFILGTNFSVGYEIMKNGDLSINQIKLSGSYRF